MRSSKFQSDPFLTLLASCPLYKFVNEVNIPLVKTAVSNWDQSIFWGVANQAILENEWEQKFLFSITIQWWSKRFLPRHQFICKEGQETVFNMVFFSKQDLRFNSFLGCLFSQLKVHSVILKSGDGVRSTKSKLNTFMTVLFQKYSNSKSPLLKRLVILQTHNTLANRVLFHSYQKWICLWYHLVN